MRAEWTDGTRAVRVGSPGAGEAGDPFLAGPVFAGTYHLPGEPEGPYQYGRYGNPTWTALERAVGELEGAADTVTFASGMAAISAVLIGLTDPGDVVVLPADGYPATRTVGDHLAARRIVVRTARTDDADIERALSGAQFVWLETPSNPGLDVCDIARVAELAHAQGALVAVDNTLATPLGQLPLALGADLSVASGTKALTGHSDILLGYVACADRELGARVRSWRSLTGAVPGPMEAWLAHRSLSTLALRVDRQAANALAIADALRARADVTDVRHPALVGDPSHDLASRTMRRFGCVVGFTLADAPTARRFLAELELVAEATSFGGVHSMAERRARWAGNNVPPGFVRFSAGCEDTADLVADIMRALDVASTG